MIDLPEAEIDSDGLRKVPEGLAHRLFAAQERQRALVLSSPPKVAGGLGIEG